MKGKVHYPAHIGFYPAIFFSFVERGRHADVFLIGPIAIKIFRKGFEGNAEKEWRFLKLLEPYKIAPKPYFKIGRVIVMERIRGKSFAEMSDEEIKKHFPAFLRILLLLDRLGIKKEECHRPGKHFIITGKGPKLIDFERAHLSKKPGNVTQFLSFLSRYNENFREVAKKYKRSGELDLGFRKGELTDDSKAKE